MSSFYTCNDPSKQQVDELYGNTCANQSSSLGPFRDQLRLTRFSVVSKLTTVDPATISAGDIVVLFDERGDIVKQNGSQIVYVTGCSVESDGAVHYKTIPFTQYNIFSKPDSAPFIPLYIDPDQLKTLSFTIELEKDNSQTTNHHCTVEGCNCCHCINATGKCCNCAPVFNIYKVLTIEEASLDSSNLGQKTDFLFLTYDIEDYNKYEQIPYPILKREKTEDNGVITYKATMQINNAGLWTLQQSLENDCLYLSVDE